jgi:hypothetical protein
VKPAACYHPGATLRDSISAIGIPVVEIHLSNIHACALVRRHPLIAEAAAELIGGFGLQSYLLGRRVALALVADHPARPTAARVRQQRRMARDFGRRFASWDKDRAGWGSVYRG